MYDKYKGNYKYQIYKDKSIFVLHHSNKTVLYNVLYIYEYNRF